MTVHALVTPPVMVTMSRFHLSGCSLRWDDHLRTLESAPSCGCTRESFEVWVMRHRFEAPPQRLNEKLTLACAVRAEDVPRLCVPVKHGCQTHGANRGGRPIQKPGDHPE